MLYEPKLLEKRKERDLIKILSFIYTIPARIIQSIILTIWYRKEIIKVFRIKDKDNKVDYYNTLIPQLEENQMPDGMKLFLSSFIYFVSIVIYLKAHGQTLTFYF